MAQIHIKSKSFESEWRPRLNLAAELLRRFREDWLLTEAPFPTRVVVAALLHVFTFDFHQADYAYYVGITADELWNRSLAEWRSVVGNPEDECRLLCPNRPGFELAELVDACSLRLLQAADTWEHKGPGVISCEEVAHQMVDELVSRRFVAIRYG